MTVTRQVPIITTLEEQDEEGCFNCPLCGNTISPDDVSDTKYVVVDAIMRNHKLTKVIVRCLNCGSVIDIVTFEPQLPTRPKRHLVDRAFDFVENVIKRHRARRLLKRHLARRC